MLSPSSAAAPRAARPAPRRAGPDACPGALAVHEAADGGLARVRLPGGRLPAAALLALAEAADRLGSGLLELTSRGNVQVRGLRAGAGAELAARLRAAGLLPSDTHERVRNVVASPLTGLLGGRADVSGVVRALDRGLCRDPVLAGLPGRFLFCVDDGSADVSALGADVGLLALGREAYALLLGGADSGLRVPPGGAADAALAAARAFLDVRTAEGSPAWRVAELDGGPAAIAGCLAHLDHLPDLDRPDRGVGDALTVPRPPEAGAHARGDGRIALVALVPAGRMAASAARALAGAAAGELRVTPWRSVVVPDLAPADVGRVGAALAAHGLVPDPGSPWSGVTACAGTPGCAKALADVRTAAAATPAAATPAQRGGSSARPLPVHWAACERRCGRPAGRHVEVLATAAGFEVRLDGRLLGTGDAEQAGRVAARTR